MDYETADGSQFSLREVLSEDNVFQSTLITAFVDGRAYAGTSPQRMKDLDDVDVIQYLEPVPPENVHPLLPEGFTAAPPFDPAEHYLKAPQFTYDDSRPGKTFVADCLLNEAKILEKLQEHPHSSIVKVLPDRAVESRAGSAPTEIHDGVEHLHSLGLAHNDIGPENICVDAKGHAVIVDFDSCRHLGEPHKKGFVESILAEKHPTSARENDLRGSADIETFMITSEQVIAETFAGSSGALTSSDDRPHTAPS